jgi:hypothetical protein
MKKIIKKLIFYLSKVKSNFLIKIMFIKNSKFLKINIFDKIN